MVLTVSLYPLLATKTGFTCVYSDDIESSKDIVGQMQFMQRSVIDTLEKHSDNTDEIDEEDVNEYERYTMIVTFHSLIHSGGRQFPFTIHHSQPVRYTCTKTFYKLTKKEIVAEMQNEIEKTITETS